MSLISTITHVSVDVLILVRNNGVPYAKTSVSSDKTPSTTPLKHKWEQVVSASNTASK